MDNRFVWATEDIYENTEAWEKEFEETGKDLDFSEFAGKLGDKKSFLACMKKQESVSRKIEKLSLYAMLYRDKDTSNSFYGALSAKVMNLAVKYESAVAFVTPELTALPEEKLKGYIADKDLSDYDYMLSTLLKSKAHILSEKEEKLLAESGEALSSFIEIFTKINNADIQFEKIKNGKETIQLSHGMYGVVMRSHDRNLRKRAYKSYYKSFENLLNTITSTYYGSVKKDVFNAKARNYGSTLEMALATEDVTKDVYDNLITSVDKALPLLHEYMRVKKKELGLKKMYMYDMYVPTVENAEIELEYDDAYNLVIEGLKPFVKEYGELLKKAHDERWVDVYETKGKKSGAYSAGVFDTHPYVLLNYQKTTNEVFTIAHEMGHSMHTYFSNRTQPYAKADYKIFVAEVASTVNEVMLVNYLLSTAKDDKLKKYLLSYLLEMIRTTLFRQTQFSEFEQYAHETVEKGEPLTKDGMSAKYAEINEKYYGDAIEKGCEIRYEWARIPHFYRAFYVYKYATGITSALAIANRILTEGEPAVKDYFKFLSSGGSDSPVELLKIAGVDLTKKEPFEAAFKTFENALEQFKKL